MLKAGVRPGDPARVEPLSKAVEEVLNLFAVPADPAFSPEDFLRRPRSARSAPSPAELLRVLEEQLSPAAVYRVRWSTRDLPGTNDLGEDIWDDPALR